MSIEDFSWKVSNASGSSTQAQSAGGIKKVWNLLDALAFAADEHAGHRVRDLAGFGKRGVGAVPAGVRSVVAGGTSLTMAALSAGAAVQDNFVRSGGPILVDEELCHRGDGRGGLADQPDFGNHLLQA